MRFPLAVTWPADENCAKVIASPPSESMVVDESLVHTKPVARSVEPSSTKMKAPAISAGASKSVARLHAPDDE